MGTRLKNLRNSIDENVELKFADWNENELNWEINHPEGACLALYNSTVDEILYVFYPSEIWSSCVLEEWALEDIFSKLRAHLMDTFTDGDITGEQWISKLDTFEADFPKNAVVIAKDGTFEIEFSEGVLEVRAPQDLTTQDKNQLINCICQLDFRNLSIGDTFICLQHTFQITEGYISKDDEIHKLAE